MKKFYMGFLLILPLFIQAQTDIDAIMMSKNNFCFGAVYQYSGWDEYWEGDFQRENLNLGTVTTKSIGIMGNYGISDKLNVLFSLPYVETNASAGTMKGQKGIQDLTLTLKYMPIEKTIGKSTYSVYALANVSAPLSNYPADYLPLSIGMQSKTASLRLMGDYQRGNFFTTLSGAYVKRGNSTIDRNSYLTNDEVHYTNEVDMPDAISVNFRAGYRSNRLIAELVLDNWVTQSGGFDITKNNMPFPSNTMNALRYGVNSKYTFKKMPQLSLVGGFNYVAEGKNVGKSDTYYGGVFYVINFKKEVQDEK
ncbi:transporter [Flavobacterium lacustre]|uniref:transporter n=1 Tax=Flavobacterium lacustre TaxID=3016339 RepID=UPI0022B68EEE|nr:transporter [Flavobacterium lacustre]